MMIQHGIRVVRILYRLGGGPFCLIFFSYKGFKCAFSLDCNVIVQLSHHVTLGDIFATERDMILRKHLFERIR